MKIKDMIRTLKGYFRRHEQVLTSDDSQPAATPDVDRYQGIYTEGVDKFEAGEWSEALDLFANYFRATEQEHLVAADSGPYGLPDSHSYEELETRFQKMLDEKRAQWEAAPQDLPPFLAWLRTPQPRPMPARGQKILFLIPQYIQNSKEFIEADFKDHLLETAANAGADVQMFPTDRCSYPDLRLDREVSRQELARISDRIAAFRPDFVVVDGNYSPTQETLNPQFLNNLKKRFGFKVIVFIGDAWGRPWIGPADSWSDAGDTIYHFAPDSPLQAECRSPEKLHWDAWLVNERNFFPDPHKELDISFVGTHTSALRPFWLSVALLAAKQLHLKQRLMPHRREAGVALTIEDYARVLRRSRMVLNFSSRYGSYKMMTGRTWQAMTAGVVLLDEENRFTPFYFVPFIHYIPYSTRSELEFAMRFFARNDEFARKIGASASAFCREHYSSEAIWSRLLGAARAAR